MCIYKQLGALISWIVSNEILLNLTISFLSFVVTSILTIVIIAQTSKLAKKQNEQEIKINEQQQDWQKRQMRIDTFDYKNNIYRALCKVFQLTGEIVDIFPKIRIYEKEMDQLCQLFDILLSQLKIDVSETLWLFKQAEYILPENIYASVRDIAKDFDELTGDIGKFKFYPTILTPEEVDAEKNKLLDDIQYRAEQINRHVLFITTIMPHELDISALEK